MPDDRDLASGNFHLCLSQQLALVVGQIQRFRKMEINTQRGGVVAEQEFDHPRKGVDIHLVLRGEGRDWNVNDASWNGPHRLGMRHGFSVVFSSFLPMGGPSP